jgi:hypothetical protein
MVRQHETPENTDSTMKTIKIYNEQNELVARFKTNRPEWSFEQYCRNRITPDWYYKTV